MESIVQPEQVLEISEKLRKCSSEIGPDSGVDNSSDSGASSDDDHKSSPNFSSTESLDDVDPPSPSDTVSVRVKSQEFIEYEKRNTIIAYDPVEVIDSAQEVAVLDIEQDTKTDNLKHLPPYFQDLYNAKEISADFNVPLDVKPPWYNEEKYKRGQRFAQSHLFCLNFAETLSLFLIFAIESAVEPLVFTGRSSTPFKAFQRYLSTLTRVMSWYQSDIWDENCHARRHLATVRLMHRNVQQKRMAASPTEVRKRTKIGSDEPVWSTVRPFVLDDFKASCPMPAAGSCPMTNSNIWVNQCDMTVTQFAFVGLAVTYPKQFGIHHATDDDLDGFLHVWRLLGHLLGIQDRYNFCNGTLEEVRQRTRDFIKYQIKTSLRNVSLEWEHMARCMVQGVAFYVPLFSFEPALKYLCTVLEIHTPRLDKSLSIWQSFLVKAISFTFNTLCKLPGLVSFYNKMMLRAIKVGQDASPSLLRKWENTQFPYMKQVPVKAV